MNEKETFERALAFIQRIGIETEYRSLDVSACFLPGLLIENGKIIIDEAKLKNPGDILHDAAHLAVVPEKERGLLNGPDIQSRKDAPAEEMMCIAWSYAACCYLDIDPAFVFHDDGYRGGSDSIIENFKNGKYVGVAILEWLGMTTTKGQNKYPVMNDWLRKSELPAFNS